MGSGSAVGNLLWCQGVQWAVYCGVRQQGCKHAQHVSTERTVQCWGVAAGSDVWMGGAVCTTWTTTRAPPRGSDPTQRW